MMNEFGEPLDNPVIDEDGGEPTPPTESLEPEEPLEPENPDAPPDSPEEPDDVDEPSDTDEPMEPTDPSEPEEPDPNEPPLGGEESEDMKALKLRLREVDYPLFLDEELQYFLDTSKDLDEATYKAAIIKSEANGLTLNGVEIESMSRFFLRIAAIYRPTNSGDLRG